MHITRNLLAVTTAIALGLGLAATRANAAESDFNAVESFITEKLDSTQVPAEQKTKIVAVFRENFAALQKCGKKFAAEQRALLDTLVPVSVEEKAIRDQAGKLADALVEYTKLRSKVVEKLQDVFTNDQLAAGQDAQTKLTRFVDGVAKQLAKD